MPEKPKRRNKNKNKRKNKNNRPDNNKSSSEVIEKDNEPCDVDSECQNDNVEASVSNNAIEQCIHEIPNSSQITCDTTYAQVNNQDLNNNSNNLSTQALNILVQTLGVPALGHDLPGPSIVDVEDGSSASQDTDAYTVESPEQSLKLKSKKSKLTISFKSKSLDDDEPKIVEITEDIDTQSENEHGMPIMDTSNALVSDIDSYVEWEKADVLNDVSVAPLDEVATGTVSITAVPLNVATCQQTKPLTPEMEISLRNYLKTLDISTHPGNIESVEVKAEIEQIINREIKHRLRKKALADDLVLQRLGPPRMLDVIDEEGSSESSMTSRRQSYLSDKKSDVEDLEDDVFEDSSKVCAISQKVASSFPKKSFGRLVPQQCVLVGAKLIEPEITEARGDWTMSTVEKMTGAEVVYLTDSSSSTSSLHDFGDEIDDGVETDVTVRMITPTIEVTDTENLLKQTFLPETKEEKCDSPINKNTVLPVKTDDLLIGIQEINKPRNCNNENNPNEIVVLSTENLKTNLYVKEIPNTEINNDVYKIEPIDKNSSVNDEKHNNDYDIEMKVLKCELNDAINNLIKEVSESEPNENTSSMFVRQDSSSSVSSSQCTAKYNPTHSSLNDVSNMVHDEISENNIPDVENTEIANPDSHVKEVFEHVTGTAAQNKKRIENNSQPLFLRDICVKRITKFPFGDKILEELASVSKRIQNIASRGVIITESSTGSKNCTNESSCDTDMPCFPLPGISSIEKVILPSKDPVPPPVQPRHSSLRREKSREEDVWTGVPSKNEPVYVCLSPSQKMLMEKTNTVLTKDDASELVSTHKNYADRRGYNEYYRKENRKDESGVDETPIVPFKSQTGSRLLALIRDPNLTNSINSINKQCSSEILENKFSSSQNFAIRNNIILGGNSDTFRPIPPPRPKKMSAFYESDESSDFTDCSLRSIKSERKLFHYSTGNLSKEIEDDVSSIQQMHRNYTNIRDKLGENRPRRPSLPKDLCDQQMEYIRQKEKEVEAEIRRLEAQSNNISTSTETKTPRAPLISEKEFVTKNYKDSNNFYISKQRDFFEASQNFGKVERPEKGRLYSVFSRSQEELNREKMYSEYVTQMAEREERKQHKVIKITNTPVAPSTKVYKSMPALDVLDSRVNNRIEKEFICKARERWDKLGIKDPETEDERDTAKCDVYREPKVIEHKIKVIEGDEERDMKNLPRHLQEFVRFTAKDKEKADSSETVMIAPTFKARSTSPAVWRPGAPTPPPAPADRSPGAPPPPPPPPVWTPGSAGSSPQAPRKPYRPVHFEDTTPPPRRKFGNAEQNGCTSGSESEGRLRTSQSAPVTGLNTLGGSTVTSRLPKAQNPTVTLLQKAREGQIPRGSNYIQQEKDTARLPRDRPSPPRGDPVHALRREYASETEGERSDHERGSRKMADAPKKIEGIGPITKDGMPVSLRSEVKDPSKWYKKMYDTIHKNKYDDDYVTIRYKSRRGQPPERVSSNRSQYAYFDPRSGYLSEPEGGLGRLGSSTWSDAYDSDVTTGPRRRTASVQEERRNEPYTPSNKYSTLASARASQEMYKQPGRIENYVPGRSSVVDKEAKQWWDEVMDIFDGQNISSTTSLPQASPREKKDITSAILSKSNMARALKESGYESDSTLVFRRREETEGPLSPAERRAAYRDLQAGGEPPLRGFRSPAPPRQESPRRYVESDVNIHYRCPVRQDPLPLVPERELARQQAEHMKRLYREQRRNKYLQELQDMQNRRHQDNFTPSQKNILPLNRYDEAEKVVAKALYTFNGQTTRELSFRKGEIIHVRRQVDANWYEGELHGRVGLFPYNYVEIQKGDNPQPQKKPIALEGRARAKFDFTAQTNLELPLKKGEVVVLTRRIDNNWWEGRNGNKTGIFPDSYVTILQEPTQNKPDPQLIMNHKNSSHDKPVASPAAHGLMNGTAKRSIGPHSYTPQHNSPALSNAPPATQPLPGYAAKTAQPLLTPSERGYGPPTGQGVDLNNTEPLYVDTNAEAIPYRAMYKYRPQNPDELELNEGDTVYVLEKCDDGWYVGSSQRTGRFGTFPGNYVERI